MDANTERLDALDILRGLSVIAMILVITPGSWAHRFSWLDHAAWAGFAVADMIFPTFLFCVGISLAFSLDRRFQQGRKTAEILQHIFFRSTALVAIGLLTAAFPSFDWANLRIPGVLQRIGLCWFICSLLFFYLSRLTVHDHVDGRIPAFMGISLAILLGYWALLSWVPVPGFGIMRFDSLGSLPAYVDRLVFGVAHLWPYGTTDGVVTYDPEGLLSTLPACVNVMAGIIVGLYYQKSEHLPLGKTLAISVVLIVCGVMMSWYFPMIKKIWTSSFALISSGFSLLLLVVIRYLCTLNIVGFIAFPCKVYGANALLGFVLAMLMVPLLDVSFIATQSGIVSVRTLCFQIIQMFIQHAEFSSLIFSLVFLLALFGLLFYLNKKSYYLRV